MTKQIRCYGEDCNRKATHEVRVPWIHQTTRVEGWAWEPNCKACLPTDEDWPVREVSIHGAQVDYLVVALEELIAEHDEADLPETCGTTWARHALGLWKSVVTS